MILADKIIRLRKMNGWSQEELADKMNVSRQAVSKWEAAQTTPDLERILQMSKLFGVTTDYLLKDEIEDEAFIDSGLEDLQVKVTMEDANAYIEHRKWASVRIAFATLLCILSPISLLMMGAMSETPNSGMTENFAGLFGLIVLFVFVAVAVAIYIYVDAKKSPYKYLTNDSFELAYGVLGMVREKKNKFHDNYMKCNIIGTCMCILAPVLLFIGAFTEDAVVTVFFLSLMLVVVGVAVFIFITVGVRWASLELLLREGDYSKIGKKKSKVSEAVGTAFWLLTTAIYVGWSFRSDAWEKTWSVWPVAAMIFVAIMSIISLIVDKENHSEDR